MLFTQKIAMKNESLDRLTDALVLAVTAPSDKQSEKALALVHDLVDIACAHGAGELDIWMARENAEKIINTGQAGNI